MNSFKFLLPTDAEEVLRGVRATHWKLGMCPSWLVEAILEELGPLLVGIVKASLRDSFKSAIVKHLLKMPSFDVDSPSNHQSVFNLPF